MFGNGKKVEVIIKVLPRVVEGASMFGSYTQTREYDVLEVWAESGYKQRFLKIAGVFEVREGEPEPRYYIFIDPRYETNFVVKEVEAVINIYKPPKRRKKEKEKNEDDE